MNMRVEGHDFRTELDRWRVEDNERKVREGYPLIRRQETFFSAAGHWIAATLFVAVCAYFSFFHA